MPNGIVLYGATGFTGRLVTEQLKRRRLAFTLAGRSADKLTQLANEVGGAPIAAVDVRDAQGLIDLLQGARVVINCAGPFSKIGELVVAAAVASGTHYADTTGEQLYIERLFRAYGARARQAGVTVLPAIGFDFLPGDMLANLTAEGLGPLEDMTLAYYVTDMQPTHGTMLSAVEIMRCGKLVYEDGYVRRSSGSFGTKTFEFGHEVGSKPFVDYPSGEIVTVPRHVDTRRMTSLLSASAIAPENVAPFLGTGTRIASVLAKTPLLALINKGVQRLPEGPGDEQRSKAAFAILARASTTMRRREGVARGNDVYGITAVICAEAAERMSSDSYDRAGVLAPSEAFDAGDFLRTLEPHGLTVEIEAAEREPALA